MSPTCAVCVPGGDLVAALSGEVSRAAAAAAGAAAASEATVRVAATAPAVLRVLNLVGIDQFIEVHPSVAEAVASLPAQCAEPRA